MSHELRAPLKGIPGHAQILLQCDATEATMRRRLRAILSSAQHLRSMIHRILDLPKIEAGRIELERRPVELYSLPQHRVRLFDIEKSGCGARFSAQCSLGDHAVAVRDPQRFGRADAWAAVAMTRAAAGLGQIRRVKALVGQLSDPALQRTLLDVLGPGLREQDSEIVLKRLEQALGEAV